VKLDTLIVRASVAVLVFAGVTWSMPRPAEPKAPSEAPIATRIEQFSWQRLAVPYPTGRCETASHVTYAREPGATIADHWYISSQIMANIDLARVTAGSTAHLDCVIERSFTYLEMLWQMDAPRGYAPRSDIDGRNPTTVDIYADDNAIAGIAMLNAAEYVHDASLRDRMMLGAVRAARFLIDSGLWDEVYGGGFWWNTQRQQSEGGKPVQTAGLAAQLFARLYQTTGVIEYRDWADRAMVWSDRQLFDEDMGLYRYGFRASLPDKPKHPDYVNYDQAIMIEAHLAMRALGDARLDHLERARTLASSLARFRSPLGGYEFELGVPQVFSHYSAWTSIGLLELYAVDRNPTWLANARDSLQDLSEVMVDPLDGGVYYDVYECIPIWISGCPVGARSAVDERKLHLSQSWMQRALALLARAQ
jgi:hypothetical protein